MKKKFLSMLLGACLTIPCAFIMSACDGNDDPPAPTVQSSRAKVTNSDYSYNESEDCITFLLLDDVDFQKTDFEIVQTFSDDTTKTLDGDKWELDLSEIPEDPIDDGYYRIVFKYADKDEELDTINVTFVSEKIDLGNIELQTFSNTYTGEEIDVVDLIDDYLVSQGKPKISPLVESGIVTIVNDSNSTRTATNVGQYSAGINLADGYDWNDNFSGTRYISWRIDKANIPAPTLVNNSFEYEYEVKGVNLEGVAQSVEYTFGNFPNALQFVDINRDTEMDGVFQTTATNVGDYKVKFDIKEEYASNYTFLVDDYNVSSYELDWEITPTIVTIPTLKQDVFTYNPNGFDPTIAGSNLNNYNSALMTLTNEAGNVPTVNSSTNYISVELKDTHNFLWNDEPATNYTQYLFFRVDKANYELEDFDESKLKMEITWTPYLLLNSLNTSLSDYNIEYTNWTSEARTYLISKGFEHYHTLEWKEDPSQVDLAQLGAGTHTFKMKYNPDYNNYNNIEIDVTVEVLKEVMCVTPDIDGSDFVDPTNIKYDADTLDIYLEDITEQEHVKNYSTNIVYSVGYKAEESGEYQYNNYTHAQLQAINGEIGKLMKNAGFYDLKISITADDNHLFHLVDTDESTAVQNFEAHQPIVIKPYELNMAMGLSHGLDSNYYSISEDYPKFYYKNGQEVEYTITEFYDSYISVSSDEIYKNLNVSTLVENTMDNLPTCKTYYRANESDEWSLVTKSTDVGYYKNVYEFTSKYPQNVKIVPFEKNWEIIPSNINFTGIMFNQFENPTYTGEGYYPPTFKEEYIPTNVIYCGYTHSTGVGYSEQVSSWQSKIDTAGEYKTTWWFKVPNHVTVTYLNEPISSSMFEKTSDENYTTYSCSHLWEISKHVLKSTEVNFDSFVGEQSLVHTGEELSPEYQIVFNEEFGDHFKSQFVVIKTTKQGEETVTPVNVGEYQTTVKIKINKLNIEIDESWASLLGEINVEGNFYYITRTITWSIVSANA